MTTPKSLVSNRAGFPIFLSLLLLAGMTGGCNESEPSAMERIVPDRENIPHFDRDHIPVGRSLSFEELTEKPAELDLLYQYLRDPVDINRIRLDLMVSGPGPGFGVEAVTHNRLLILDGDRNHLVEYDLDTHQSYSIAEQGSGPGDIQYPRDMILEDTFIYVAREDMYVIRFDCSSTPCEADEAVSLDFRPVSIAISGDQYAVLGIPDPQSEKPDRHPLRAISLKGEKIDQFGDAYDAGDHRMISFQFGMNGKVRYSPSTGLFVLKYGAFPYLYLYDSATLELQETYEFSDFILPQFTYSPAERSIHMPVNDHHQIRNIRFSGENLLFIEVMTLDNFRREMPPWDYRFHFYAVKLDTRDSYYLGNYERTHLTPGKEIFVTGRGLVIYDYVENALYWAGVDAL